MYVLVLLGAGVPEGTLRSLGKGYSRRHSAHVYDKPF